MYYIEFVGQHTAGKTTTLCKVVDEECLSPYTAFYPQQIHRSAIDFAFSMPMIIFQNMRHLFFVILFFCRYAKWHWTNYRNVGRHLMKQVILHPYYDKFDFDIWLKDDMLHLLPRILFKNGVDVATALQEYFNHFSYLYDGIVYMDISREDMQKRIENRLVNRPVQRRRDLKIIYERTFCQNILLRQVLKDQKSVPCLFLNGNGDLQKNVEAVSDFIRVNILSK